MSRDQQLKERWEAVVKKLSDQFADGEELDLDAIIYLIGVQELGQLHRKFEKDEKLNLMHIAICRLLQPYGYCHLPFTTALRLLRTRIRRCRRLAALPRSRTTSTIKSWRTTLINDRCRGKLFPRIAIHSIAKTELNPKFALSKFAMIDQIKAYIQEVEAFQTTNKNELEQFRIKFIGSKGILKDLFAAFKTVPNEEKKAFGQLINQLKNAAEEKVAHISATLEAATLS